MKTPSRKTLASTGNFFDRLTQGIGHACMLFLGLVLIIGGCFCSLMFASLLIPVGLILAGCGIAGLFGR